jgi:membrane protein implicated in regulation of membrane protease activity
MPDSSAHDTDKVNWPSLTEKDWYVLAICLAIGAIIAALFAAMWVFGAASVTDVKQRVDVLTPFGAIYLALMTFCTVAWRGMVTSRQADQQKRQNDANDEANYSKLLQEAAKLIAEKEKIPQVVAGISTLEILLTEPQQRYGLEAMDLLADLLMDTYGYAPLNSVNRATLRALKTGERNGLRSRIDGKFERPIATDSNRHRWTTIPGLRSLSFVGGTMTRDVHETSLKNIRSLKKVRLQNCEIYDWLSFSNCEFHHCRIREIDELHLESNRFYNCDFSGCKININVFGGIFDLKKGNNFYIAGKPPKDSNGEDKSAQFITYEEYLIINEDDLPF